MAQVSGTENDLLYVLEQLFEDVRRSFLAGHRVTANLEASFEQEWYDADGWRHCRPTGERTLTITYGDYPLEPANKT